MTNPGSFDGFPAAGLQFLKDLSHNNNRTWFEDHKATYQTYLLEPAVAFVAELGERLQQTVSPDIRYDTRTNGSGTLLRIHRDTRFSQDKTPYKTELSGLFWEGVGKKNECPAFGFRIEADGLSLMAGQLAFTKPQLVRYREAVAADSGSALEAALAAVRRAGDYEISGQQYKRAPQGYDPNHSRADLLRYQGLHAYPPRLAAAHMSRVSLVDFCLDHFQRMAPLQQWLAKALG